MVSSSFFSPENNYRFNGKSIARQYKSFKKFFIKPLRQNLFPYSKIVFCVPQRYTECNHITGKTGLTPSGQPTFIPPAASDEISSAAAYDLSASPYPASVSQLIGQYGRSDLSEQKAQLSWGGGTDYYGALSMVDHSGERTWLWFGGGSFDFDYFSVSDLGKAEWESFDVRDALSEGMQLMKFVPFADRAHNDEGRAVSFPARLEEGAYSVSFEYFCQGDDYQSKST